MTAANPLRSSQRLNPSMNVSPGRSLISSRRHDLKAGFRQIALAIRISLLRFPTREPVIEITGVDNGSGQVARRPASAGKRPMSAFGGKATDLPVQQPTRVLPLSMFWLLHCSTSTDDSSLTERKRWVCLPSINGRKWSKRAGLQPMVRVFRNGIASWHDCSSRSCGEQRLRTFRSSNQPSSNSSSIFGPQKRSG